MAAPIPDALIATVADYVRNQRPHLSKAYGWPVPAIVPFGEFERGKDALHEANIRLRRHLAEIWRSTPSSRLEIARWYVAVWGGVKRNADETLQRYVSAAPDLLAVSGTAGVASWSKVLAVSDPERFAIFDARVSAALNALQLKRGGQHILFPRLRSQNGGIVDFNAWLGRLRTTDATRPPSTAVYATYLALVHAAARIVGDGCTPELVEMVLFANAETLASDAMAGEVRSGLAGLR